MNVTQYLSALPYLMKTKTTALVWGYHGIGKSSVPEQFCRDNGYKLFNLRLGNMEIGDLLGLADFVEDKNGYKVATKFFTPDWLKELCDFAEKNPTKWAIIHLDEINHARKDVQSCIFQIVLDYRLHTTAFPKNVYVIASANPPTEDYDVQDLTSKALRDRFCHLKFEPTVAEWMDYCRTIPNFDPEILGCINEQPALLEEKLADFSIDDFAKPSRRSWEKLNALVVAETPENIMDILGFGLVGVIPYLALKDFRRKAEKPAPIEEILKDYKNHKEKIVKWSAWDGTGKGEIINHICKDLEAKVNDIKYTKKISKNLIDFLLDIPKENLVTTLRVLYFNASIRDILNSEDAKEITKVLETVHAARQEHEKQLAQASGK